MIKSFTILFFDAVFTSPISTVTLINLVRRFKDFPNPRTNKKEMKRSSKVKKAPNTWLLNMNILQVITSELIVFKFNNNNVTTVLALGMGKTCLSSPNYLIIGT